MWWDYKGKLPCQMSTFDGEHFSQGQVNIFLIFFYNTWTCEYHDSKSNALFFFFLMVCQSSFFMIIVLQKPFACGGTRRVNYHVKCPHLTDNMFLKDK